MATTTARNRYATTAPKARNDAYTGLLFIAFLALVISSVLLYLDYSQYGTTAPQKVNVPAAGSSSAPSVPPPEEAIPGNKPGDAAPGGDGAPMPANPG